MTTRSDAGSHTSATRDRAGPLALIAGFIRAWRDRLARASELDGLDPAERARIAADIGLSDDMLRSLTAGNSDARLLDERIASLGIPASEIEALGHGVFRTLQLACANCASKAECAQDIASAAPSERWKQYCLNADTLAPLAEQVAGERATPAPAASAGDAALLYRRLDALGITAADLDRVCSLLQEDLAQVCAHCGDKAVCASDLETRPDDGSWRDYCPNATTLDGVAGLKGRSRL